MYKKFKSSIRFIIYFSVILFFIASNQKSYSMMSKQELDDAKRIVRSCGPDFTSAASSHRREVADFEDHIVYERPYSARQIGVGAWSIPGRDSKRLSLKRFSGTASVCAQCDTLFKKIEEAEALQNKK